jgi:hypothetical protein
MAFLRFCLLLFLGWIVWRLLRPDPPHPRPEKARPAAQETMRACAFCGVYVPEGEMSRDPFGNVYCCQAHCARAEGQRKDDVSS